MDLETFMNKTDFKDTVLTIYDEYGTCNIDMEFEELPGLIVSLTIKEEGDMEDE